MIRCWTIWRPRPVAATTGIKIVRRVRRAKRSGIATMALYSTIVCSVVGVGATPFLMNPGRWAEPNSGAPSLFTSRAAPVKVPEPSSVLLIGAALAGFALLSLRPTHDRRRGGGSLRRSEEHDSGIAARPQPRP